jgi:3-methylcrotonyl-CoA carboxylase alpha subunit
MSAPLFTRILIANRGEIACRVIQTARRLGIRSVAVYVPAEADALFVHQADEAWPLDGGSYLDGEAILSIARHCGAQAIHPGYGFLSENADFAAACQATGIVFIGPPTDAIRVMGSKSEAKTLLAQHGIPLVPGYHGQSQDPAVLHAAADKIGYPVLIKASAGGGGKGMRIVREPAAFGAALASCQRESMASFADDRVLVEKYLTTPRHIEIQIFADTHGQCVYLFERDCSVQRRHQKVIEEAPAPGLSAALRRSMGETACKVARAVGYVGAGTVEFIVDGTSGDYFFMEMNTRLQVEHPVTEMITGQDLVEWQLRVATGLPLPLRQADLEQHGHAIEARLYAEDPARGFLPSCGTLFYLRPPASDAAVRIDSGVTEGDTITPLFDPMLAKLIVWGEDREQARLRLDQALAAYRVAGVTTNIGFLRRLVIHPAFMTGMVDTGFIERYQETLLLPPAPPTAVQLALMALADAMAARNRDAGVWAGLPGWRLNGSGKRLWRYRQGEDRLQVEIERQAGELHIEAGGQRFKAEHVSFESGELSVVLDGIRYQATRVTHDRERILFCNDVQLSLEYEDPLAASEGCVQDTGHLKAPMPGRVVALCAEVGVAVAKGTPLMIMEAMKMEHTLFAPADGLVEHFHFQPGAQVEEGADLLDFAIED